MFKNVLSFSLTLALLLSVLSVGMVLNTSAAVFTKTAVDADTVAANHEDNLLKGLTPVVVEPTHAVDATALSKITNGTAATADAAERVVLKPTETADAHTAGNVVFYFDLGEAKTIDKVLFAAGTDSWMMYQWLYNGKVYVGDSAEGLFNNENEVLSYNYGLGGGDLYMEFLLTKAVEGRYIGFSVYHSSASERGWNDYSDNISFSEVGAYRVGADTESTAFSYKKTEVSSKNISTLTGNLLSGLTPVMTNGTTLSSTDNNTALLTDGIGIVGKKNTVGVLVPNPNGTDPVHTAGNATFYFDLGDEKLINELLVASGGNNNASYHYEMLYNGKLYVGNDPATLFTDANLAMSYDDGLGNAAEHRYFEMNRTVKGRYVGFSFYHANAEKRGWADYGKGTLEISELGVYYDANVYGVNTAVTAVPAEKNLIAGKIADKGAGQTDRDGSVLSSLTDGNLATQYNADTGSDNDGSATLWFELDNLTTIDKLYISSTTNNGAKWYLYSTSVYVSNDVDTLFSRSNEVMSANYRQGNAALGYVYELAKPVTGKYVGFMIGVNGDEWWSSCRIGELGVYGTEHSLVNTGAQLRDPEGATKHALRFVFDAYAEGVTYANDPAATADYSRDLTNATVTIGGVTYPLKDMGAIVSVNGDCGDTLTKEDISDGLTVDVQAKNLYAIDGDKVTYTAVVTSIPAQSVDTAIYAAPYIVYEDAGEEVVLYGDVITRSVADVMAANA